MSHFVLISMIAAFNGCLSMKDNTYRKRIYKRKMMSGYVKFLLQDQIKWKLSVL